MPYLTYCHLTWHFCKASDTGKVERIQERSLTIVYNSHSETYTDLLDRAKLPSLLNRRLQDIVNSCTRLNIGQFLISFVTFSVLSLVNIISETKILIFLDLILYCMVNTLLDILDPFYGTSQIKTSLKQAAYLRLSFISDVGILLN